MKDILNGTVHSIELLALAVVGIGIGSIPLGIGLTLVAFIPASKLLDDIKGNSIKNSIFSVTRDGKIHQNTLSRPLRFLSLLSKSDKQKQFTEEALNMFVELDEKDKDGVKKQYHTRSQILTLSLLKKLQKNGYIENLEYKESGKSRLISERILLGNFKDLFKNKKHKMYDISFNLTDKKRNREDILNINDSKREVSVSTSTTNNGEDRSSKLAQEKRELISLRNELINNQETNIEIESKSK
ncbi:MAG: hypothetical protein IKQ35_04665 [Bacilli bacterium]|nr:hypothetical protein [Bacilli bacterium]